MRGGRFTVRVPGRVNLIGEHTDYNDGFVLPLAIDLAVTLRGEVCEGDRVTVATDAFGEVGEFGSGVDPRTLEPPWLRYAAGVVEGLREEGLEPVGFSAVVASDLPLGGGLSSSAAFEVAVALGALEAARLAGEYPPPGLAARDRLATLCRDAEARATGARVGIMDPFIALFARPGSALLLDCRTLEHGAVPMPEDRLALVVADCGVRHEIAAGEYNLRRAECESAVRMLGSGNGGVEALRDIAPERLEEVVAALPPTEGRRVRHVVTENDRTLRAASALAAGDLERFGDLLTASHASLRYDFAVSCEEVDALVEIARGVPGVYGSRMTGGGFGGSTVTAVDPGSVPELVSALEGRASAVRVVRPSGGASVRRG